MDDNNIIGRLATLEALAEHAVDERKHMQERLDKAIALLQLLSTDMAVQKGRLGMLLWMATSMGAVVGWIMSNFARWLGKGG